MEMINLNSLENIVRLSVGLLVGILVFELASYIYFALAMMRVAEKEKTKTPKWFAWIPILNLILFVDEAGLPTIWALAFLVALIPYIGAILVGIFSVYLLWKIAEKVNKPEWYALLSLIPLVGPYITWGLLAWGK